MVELKENTMKAIINGLRYDTDKAELIGEAGNYVGKGDFTYWSAELYRTPRSKRFFLAGEGGPMTRWVRPGNGNMRTGGQGIIPLDDEEALEWAERYLTHDEIEKAFAEKLEDA
jgi:hypothetical protein